MPHIDQMLNSCLVHDYSFFSCGLESGSLYFDKFDKHFQLSCKNRTEWGPQASSCRGGNGSQDLSVGFLTARPVFLPIGHSVISWAIRSHLLGWVAKF